MAMDRRKFCRLADVADLANDPRFTTNALRVRNLFGRFCKLIGSPSMLLPGDLDQRLETAGETFGQMIASSLFAEIRLDEQMRCHLLKEQIDEWLISRTQGFGWLLQRYKTPLS